MAVTNYATLVMISNKDTRVQQFNISVDGIEALSDGQPIPEDLVVEWMNAVVDQDDNLYVINNIKGLKLDSKTSVWSELLIPSSSFAIWQHSLILMNNVLYIIYANQVFCLDLENSHSAWVSCAPEIPIDGIRVAACVMDEWIWVTGGQLGTADLFYADKSTHRWQPGKSLLTYLRYKSTYRWQPGKSLHIPQIFL